VFFLFGVEQTARQSAAVFRAVLQLKARIESEVLPRLSKTRQDNAQKLMRQLYAQPVVDGKWATRITGASVNTAAALIVDLVSFGVLVEVTGQRRNRLFVFKEYLDIFKTTA
jgi:Fic family protein